ncbi:succinate dehydrogenase complex, subunit B [Ascosphaera pollenicola]|nr:succinate dehydrogenase complex, subunit B [Ascosphaera pollenicola]
MSKCSRITCMPLVRKLRQEPRPPSGSKIMVVGMPNVGKSTLINALRGAALKIGIQYINKVARTGAQPGITRSVGGPIKIIDNPKKGNVYVYDTPGVFVPYMPDAESMLKLALCNIVKRDLIPIEILADYLLFHINQLWPQKYSPWVSTPTNDINEFLDEFSMNTGCLAKGGGPDRDAGALKFLNWWEQGKFGGFMFDDPAHLNASFNKQMIEKYGGSLNEAWKKKRMAAQNERMEYIKAEKQRLEQSAQSKL